MKSFYTIFVFFIISFCKISAQNPNWEFLGLDDKIINDIFISDSNHIFVALEPGAIYKSTDSGNTWAQKNNGITATTGMALDNDSEGSIYLAALGGVFKTTNGGENWFRIAQNLSNLEFIEVKVIPNDNILVSNFDGIHRSTDNGQTWVITDYNFFGAEEIGINANGVMFAGNITASNFSIYRSTNLGENWIFSSSLPSIAFLYPNNSDVFAGVGKTAFNPGDIYKSTDDGLTWIPTNAFPDTFFIYYNDFELDRNGDFYLAMSGSSIYSGIHISTDQVISWSNYGFSIPIKCVAIDSSGYIYAGTNQQGIFRAAGRTVPVELTSFIAKAGKNNVLLKWITATETNNYGFEIERASSSSEGMDSQTTPGQEDWVKIAFVEGKGTTTETTDYAFTDKRLSAGKYYYRLKQIDFDGSFEYSNTISVEVQIPSKFKLNQNYPNPFNPDTKIEFQLPETTGAKLTVYSVLGEKIIELVNEKLDAGYYEYVFNGEQLPSGTYIYTLKSEKYNESRKMILLK